MIRECQDIFAHEIDNEKNTNADKKILDNYFPKDGTYIINKITNREVIQGEPIEVYAEDSDDKRSRKLICSHSDVNLFKFLDYNSKLINTNKPIDKKKLIHSNNYLSFAVKKESISSGKLTDEIIKDYYNVLRNPKDKYKSNKSGLKLYEEVENSLDDIDGDLIEVIESWILGNVRKLKIDWKDNKVKKYLKIFFVLDDEEKTQKLYTQERKRYMLPNIFNSNDYNEVIKGETSGLPDNNMGMNSKKPYLELKKRGSVKVPTLLSMEGALKQAGFFDYLFSKASAGYCDIYFDDDKKEIIPCKSGERPTSDFKGYFLKLKNKKDEVIIQQYDTVASYNANLKKPFFYKKYFYDSDEREHEHESDTYRQTSRLENLIDEVLFSKWLIGNYYTDPQDISLNNGVLKRDILAYRSHLAKWFNSGCQTNISRMISKIADDMMIEAIKNGNMKKLKKILNVQLSFENYFKGNNSEEDDLMRSRDEFYKKALGEQPWELSNDEEYCFAVGQLAAYFLSRSKSKSKKMSAINEFLNAKKDEKIKNILERKFIRCNYDIDMSFMRFKNVLSEVMGYTVKEKVDTKKIIEGFASDNVMYMKKEEK